MRAEAAPHERREPIRDLRRLGAGQRGHDRRAGAAEEPLGAVERVVPRDRLQAVSAADERLEHAVVGGQVRVGEAALVADEPAVDLRVVPRLDPLHVSLARRRADVAAGRTEPAHGRDVLNLPWPRLEPILRRGQRPDRAELDHVPGEGRAIRVFAEGRDLRVRAAVPRDQLSVLRDVAREPRAAVAEDATLAVERDQRRHRDRLVERHLRERHPRRARAVPEGEVLQRALAALVADRAVERVVDEDELECPFLALCRARRRGGRAHDHPVLRAERAARLELRQPLDLDEAHAAGADRRSEPRLVAEHRDLDARGGRRLDEPQAARNLDLAVVDRQLHGVAHARSGAGRAGTSAPGSPPSSLRLMRRPRAGV